MNVLGIETSCDETAASVIRNGKEILSNIVSSSLDLHKKYGGVIPEIASRAQLELIDYVVNQAIKRAGLKLKDINLISVTENPGLLGSLLVGISFARGLSLALKIPLREVDHLKAHLYAAFLKNKLAISSFIGLVVSGGHTNLFYVKDKINFRLLGATLDDACGEAFDKVAKILNLGYPGGPIIDKLAKEGNPKKIKFSCGEQNGSLDFSFSGIKTAVLYYVQQHKKLKLREIKDVAASFQESVVDNLIEKSLLACQKYKLNTLVLGGGVIANSRLREKLSQQAKVNRIKVYFPPPEFCMDNAAMVAGIGYHLYKKQ